MAWRGAWHRAWHLRERGERSLGVKAVVALGAEAVGGGGAELVAEDDGCVEEAQHDEHERRAEAEEEARERVGVGSLCARVRRERGWAPGYLERESSMESASSVAPC